MSKPMYGLNRALSSRTVEPPVPMARAWADSFPSALSPMACWTGSSSSTSLPLLNLAQGVPGHPPHPNLIKAMTEASQENVMETHGYGPVFGDPLLRKELVNDINLKYKGSVKETEVAITSGCNLAAGVTFQALAGPGEAVVLPTPWYFNHEMTLTSLSISVLPLETISPQFTPNPAAFVELLKRHNTTEAAAASPSSLPRIKALVLVTPNNPTGSIYSKDLIWDFATICAEWKVALVVDETYRDFMLDEEKTSDVPSADSQRPLAKPHDLFDRSAHLGFEWQNSIISLHSFSKSYAIPGHRLGAIIAHSALLISKEEDSHGKKHTRFGSFAKSLDNLQICPPRTDTQKAVARSITDPEQQKWRLSVANDLLKRRLKFMASLDEKISWDVVTKQLNIGEDSLLSIGLKLDDKAISPSDVGWKGLSSGGYYAYVGHPFADTPSELVARGLAALVGVLVLPGSFFRPVAEAHLDRDLRISIANVEARKLDTLAARLLLFHALWVEKGIGWGI
ncbi:hypothetical protein CBS101457_005429 [Exobasidium rhododendri]|nr:hypothetical protein CBS101457_005429 [Exobasidium rhododendri]